MINIKKTVTPQAASTCEKLREGDIAALHQVGFVPKK